jgi:NADH-quinone oxidoreductase subunit G
VLKNAKKPLIIIGQGALAREDGEAVLALAARTAEAVGAVSPEWNGFSVLHAAASRVGALDLGFVPGENGLDVAGMAKAGALDVAFLLGADEVEVGPGAFVVYVGTHGDRGAHRADVILPGAAYTEKSGTYVNTEGRPQLASRAGFAPGEAREDWAILRALSEQVGHKLAFDSLGQLRSRLYEAHPHLARIGIVEAADPAGITALNEGAVATSRTPFRLAIDDLYLTNPIARSSAVMAECSALARGVVPLAAE